MRFWIGGTWLCWMAAASACAAAQPVRISIDGHLGRVRALTITAPAKSRARDAAARDYGRVAKILIIEDDDVIARGMARHLEAGGFDAVGVANGETGLARLRYERPDVCVLDLMLPGVDGWSVIEQARAEGIGTPIVVVSARGTEHVTGNISDVRRGAGETGAAASQVLSAAQELARHSNSLGDEVGEFLRGVKAA